jgi:hypothetical protein
MIDGSKETGRAGGSSGIAVWQTAWIIYWFNEWITQHINKKVFNELLIQWMDEWLWNNYLGIIDNGTVLNSV